MTEPIPFATERWFAEFEFRARHNLGGSDCESCTVAELLALADMSMDDVWLGYTESTGSSVLRAAIAATYDDVDPEHVVVLGAPQEGILLAMQAMVSAGDDVIVLAPRYDSLANVPRQLGAQVHDWRVRPSEDGWALDGSQLDELLEQHQPSLVVLNFPHNPTGYAVTTKVLGTWIERIHEAGAAVFCDEMYRGLGEPRFAAHSGTSHAADVALGGLSKAYGLPGLRCGWLIAPDPDVRERIIDWKHYTTICPPAPIERLAVAALSVAEQLLGAANARVNANRALAARTLGAHGFHWRSPRAGSVALVGTPWSDAEPECRKLAEEAGVLLVPGAVLGGPADHVRIGLGRADFAEGLAALAEALA